MKGEYPIMLQKLELLWLHIRSFFPSRLPVGLAEFHKWADDICILTGPIASERDMKFVLSSILIHADVKFGSLPKRYFVTRIIKSAANQVASQVFQDIKMAQAAEVEAAKKLEVAAQTLKAEAQAEVSSIVNKVEDLFAQTPVAVTAQPESATANAIQKTTN